MTTKGPWKIETEPMNVWDETGRLVARAFGPIDSDAGWQEVCDNARLIAAAPDLLAACLMVLDDHGLTASANDVIRTAIARARS